MGKRRKSGITGPKPDDYFAAGPFEFARFGKMMVGRSRMAPQQFADAQLRMVTRFPEVVRQIDDLVSQIADQIAGLPPGRLLHRAYWEFAGIAITQGTHAVEQAGAIRMLDYVQSLIASVPPAEQQPEDVSDEAWDRLSKDVKSLFDRITIEYQTCLTASRRAADPQLDMDLEEFRFRAEGIWMHVRGKRYQPHERIALAELLAPHSDVLKRLFGMSAEEIAEELDKILHKLSGGAALSMLALKKFREDSIPKMDAIIASGEAETPEEVMAKLFEDAALAAQGKAAMGEVFGLDLFDVVKVTQLPISLVDALTWAPGEDADFMAPGEFAGWPLRIWPTMKRPFIRIDGRAMCFEMWGLFDNIYRALQRLILKLEPDYREQWNAGQKEASEAIPIVYFDKLLPGNRSFAPITYQWRTGTGKQQWCECDGLVIYDDHLFVFEVKAGAFTYTSPATDLGAHLTSLRNLLAAPATQGSRFLDYLESASEVPVFDEARSEVARLKRADFRQVTTLAMSLDAFTELAARAHHLAKVGLELGPRPVWALSIDDLRVYADIVKNPLIFLHFVEQRMQSVTNRRIDLDDEMDHLGLYLAQNNYDQYAREFGGGVDGHIRFNGFREPIDEYYTAVVNSETPTLPQQDMPTRFGELIDVLGSSSKPGRAFLASFLLDGGGELRKMVADGIANQLEGNSRLRRQRPFLVAGDRPFTVCTWSPSVPRAEGEALAYTQSIVAANDGAERLLIELEYDVMDRLMDVHWQNVSLNGLSEDQLAKARLRGSVGKQQRVALARKSGKIGVNEQCPCGSGKKYKRCCRL
ncbi:MAG TPA: SEC-C metal-binding domain-containing protein [Sphingobium sp.]|uniref:SEC-C metal-binding domain-containing protein n=1 Tax=Sphingobium sp. TaxID=1912891 RepID=UPI002ED4A929